MASVKPDVDPAETPLLTALGGSTVVAVQPTTYTDKYAGLTPYEISVLREQVETPIVKTTFFSAYRFATKKDILLVALAVLLAMIEGSLKALMPIMFGLFAQNFVEYIQSRDFYDNYGGYENFLQYNATFHNVTNIETTDFQSKLYFDSPYYNGTFNDTLVPQYISPYDFQRQANYDAVYFIYFAVVEFITSYASTFVFNDRGEILAARIRKNYLASIMKQNMAYFDNVGTGEITTRISSDTLTIQDGISEKLGYLISFSSTFACSFIVGYSLSPRLAGLLTSIAVLIVASFYFASSRMTALYNNASNGASSGGSVIDEILSSIRNVQAFGIQERLAAKYDSSLSLSQKYAQRAGFYAGAITGIAWLGLYLDDAMVFWQGAQFLARGEISLFAVVTILPSMVLGLLAITSIAPHVRAVTAATSAINKIYTTIDRESAIDSSSKPGRTLSRLEGNIELKNIKFIYPSRPDVTVMQDFNLQIKAGATVALVGASGSGKSTIVGLIERFYNPVCGQVLLDGVDINDLSVKWLRRQIGLVSQEPILFAGTIFENVAYGLVGTPHECASEIEQRELVEKACREANAMIFIDSLPKGLDTHVGERGFLLSGGQKQRLAIARAIVANPKLLLLDEATSALDTNSEGIVQDALDKASKNRTTIVIAHRLSTVTNADMIVVMKSGTILERGTHEQLIALRGHYFELVQMQSIQRHINEEIENFSDNALESHYAENSIDEKAVVLDDQDRECWSEEDKIWDSNKDAGATQLLLSRSHTAKSISSFLISNVEGLHRKYSVIELVRFLFELSLPERNINIAGLVCAVIMAAGYPYNSIIYSDGVDALGELPDVDRMNQRLLKDIIIYLIMGAIELIFPIMTVGLFTYAGQRLVRRIRMRTLRQISRQDISFFDKTENTAGALTFAISRDSGAIEALSGVTLGQIVSSLIMIFGGLGVGLVVAVKLAAVTSPCVPLLLAAGCYKFYLLAKHQENLTEAYSKSSSYASEAAAAIKTVAALTREDNVVATYASTLDAIYHSGRRQNSYAAAIYGIAQALVYLTQCLMFWYGSNLIRTDGYSVFMFFVAVIAIVNGSQYGSIIFTYAVDMAKAYDAAGNIKRLYDKTPVIDSWSDNGVVPQNVQGDVEFKNVHFRYPTRPNVPVLRGLNLSIKKGQYVALVGASGCGKSTTVGLIERFYDPLSGQVLLDGQDVSSLNINAYRSHIALVQQEPTLYSGTVRENVKYGSLDSEVSDEKMIEVCKQANIHDFIMSLPDGYDTMCGAKGSLFSGGQKQRIAIARALIRNPKILLLDEATSALDNESEKIVQAALDNAAKGRTTIAIAHRLSTIQKADLIFVLENGRVLESGTHQELLANKSRYYELVKLQELESKEH
ncbi:P-loop containing nucleoside triphosphate hydrolase protein [Lipomyces kononenkoae]|uniref:P-loop containing nucleoside triphosphate hydrolase protein n=1 Tax=Lipomyces kononenkoae TaxID=34357 RepID=A0ACC3SWC7_LIPKO